MLHCRCLCQGQTRLPGQILNSGVFNQFCYCTIRTKGRCEFALENRLSLLITHQNETVKNSGVFKDMSLSALHLDTDTFYGKIFVDTCPSHPATVGTKLRSGALAFVHQ